MMSESTGKRLIDEVTTRATNSIDKILRSSSNRMLDPEKSHLNNTRNLLNKLAVCSSQSSEWVRLFCRRLKRLIDYNDSLSSNFWINMHSNILYAVNGPNFEQDKNDKWKQFLKQIEFERKLEQRELQFEQTFGQQKNFRELFDGDKKSFDKYLQKCISLHLKIPMGCSIENINSLLSEPCGLTKNLLTPENRKSLKEKLQSTDIIFDCSDRAFKRYHSQYFRSDESDKTINNSLSSFLPSVEPREVNDSHKIENIQDVFANNRWLVILGDPGSGKTTVLRWIMRIFAEKASRDDEEVLKRDHHFPVRIPILLRLNEFAEWINLHPTKTLMDYVGEHTWFGERYCHDHYKSVLKESIVHGHALILFDGFDEISETDRKIEIVNLLTEFIDKYVRAPDFISAFDNKLVGNSMLYSHRKFAETQSPNKSGGNQIVITSRIIGYRFYSLHGPFISHYSLLLMDNQQQKKFIQRWLIQVEKHIREILLSERIQLDENIVETLMKKRYKAMEIMLTNSSQLLFSNPSVLSLICTYISDSFDQFQPKVRIEVYDYAIQTLLCSELSQKPSISKNVLHSFLDNFARYLHLQSPSGLIDRFDMEQLFKWILKQQNESIDRQKLSDYMEKLICWLNSSKFILAEQGLQVFGFRHLSFQEYFVARVLVKDSSIQQIATRMVTFCTDFRFRESLLLALGWISYELSLDDYDKFCSQIITSCKDYAIPLGTLLIFDAFNDIHKLPSKTVIFTALNNIFDYSSNMIIRKYLTLILPKLSEDILVEWMQSYLNDDKQLLKFCECISMPRKRYHEAFWTNQKSLAPIVYQQLWSFHHKNPFTEFIVDQTLRRILTSVDISNQIFHQDLSSYLLSHNICISSIHPLIASVLIAVCGGISLKNETSIIKIQFSTKQIHRESSILKPILAYFSNKDESHSIKIQTLTQDYESVLQQSSPTDASADIIDVFIALICLQGLSQTSSYKKYDGYQGLPLALDRLKWTWFYLKKSYDSIQDNSDIDFIISEISSIMNMYFSLPNQSDEQCLSFSIACASAWKKIGLWDLSERLNSDIFHDDKIDQYFQHQPAFIHFINNKKLDLIAIALPLFSEFILKPSFLFMFLPSALQPLYYYAAVSPTENSLLLPHVVFLSYCLTHLEEIDKNNLNFFLVLSLLQPLFKEYKLENYALMLFKEKYFDDEDLTDNCRYFLENMKDRQLLDQFLVDEPKTCEILITEERQRICQAKILPNNNEKDVRLFAASISLARIFQFQYRCDKNPANKRLSLSPAENQEVYLTIRNIHDSVLRIIALSIILDMKDPLIFGEKQRDQLRWEMIFLLQHMLPNLPLLTSTFLFIQCYNARQFFPLSFQYMANIIGKQLNQRFKTIEDSHQTVAYIALRQLNNSDLSHYLSMFTKKENDLSDFFECNSTIFHQYFLNTTSFDSVNNMLLSSMYLVELAFDGEILKMYSKHEQKNNIPSLKEFQQISNDSTRNELIMTSKMATWITNYLQKPNNEELHQIIGNVSYCSMIEEQALSIIEKWLGYRTDKILNFFAHYAALQLIIGGSQISDLFNIVNEMFLADSEFRLTFLVKHLLNLRHIHLDVFRQILVALHRNIHYSSKIALTIDRKEIFDRILNLEFKRVNSSKTTTNSFLLMIQSCSKDLQAYLAKYYTRIRTCDKIEFAVKEEYIAIITKWIITTLNNTRKENFSIELYKYIFTLLHDQQFPQVQKTIANALNLVFTDSNTHDQNIFLQEDSITELEKVICSYNKYSDELVTACLLAYGNYLLVAKKLQINRNPSNEMQRVLSILETSSSEIISIRATFCSIFIKYSNQKLNTISNWFENKSDKTPEKRYKVLLQQTLYGVDSWHSVFLGRNAAIIDHLGTWFDEYFDRFVDDLYNYLCNKDTNNYLADPTPDYVKIALMISQKKPKEFCDAVHNSCFGENEFKNKISFFCKNNPGHSEALVKLYTVDGKVTVELIDMLKGVKDGEIYKSWACLSQLKHVSDRDAVENLFQTIASESSTQKRKIYLSVLKSLVQARLISFLEVHQRLSPLINASFDDNESWRNSNLHILELLLDLSCIKDKLLTESGKTLFTKHDIDEEYEKENECLKNLSVLSERNQFLRKFSKIYDSFDSEADSMIV